MHNLWPTQYACKRGHADTEYAFIPMQVVGVQSMQQMFVSRSLLPHKVVEYGDACSCSFENVYAPTAQYVSDIADVFNKDASLV